MSVHSLINPNATAEIGPEAFFAANEAARVRRVIEHREERQAAQRELEDAIREFVKSREPSCPADYDEAELRVGDVVWMASCLPNIVAAFAPTFAKLQNNQLAEGAVTVADIADAFTDRLSPELASVFCAAIKAGVQ